MHIYQLFSLCFLSLVASLSAQGMQDSTLGQNLSDERIQGQRLGEQRVDLTLPEKVLRQDQIEQREEDHLNQKRDLEFNGTRPQNTKTQNQGSKPVAPQ